MAAWEQVAGQGYRPSAWQVKRLLIEERIPGSSAVARFVGVEAYEAGGGKVLRDLFSREDDSAVWFDDPALLTDLAMEKLRAFKDELATRWKWAMSMVEVDWNTTARYGRIHPEPAERTPEEQAEIEKLEARQGVLAELDDDDWTEELVREAETIETRLDEIEGVHRGPGRLQARGFRDRRLHRHHRARRHAPGHRRAGPARGHAEGDGRRGSPAPPRPVPAMAAAPIPPGSRPGPIPAASPDLRCPGP